MNVDKFKQLFAIAKRQRRLKLQEEYSDSYYTLPKKLPLETFIILFFASLNDNYVTLSLKNKFVCSTCKNRTITDTWGIARYYYPKVSFKEFLITFIKIAIDKKTQTFVCGDIDRRIWYPKTSVLNSSEDITNLMYDAEDEFGLKKSDYTKYYTENYVEYLYLKSG